VVRHGGDAACTLSPPSGETDHVTSTFLLVCAAPKPVLLIRHPPAPAVRAATTDRSC